MAKLSPRAPSQFTSPHGAPSIHLDALRGIAAVGVFLSHLRDLLFKDYPQLPHHNPPIAALYFITGLGREWVMLFFVLSGYLVGGGVLRALSADRWSWSHYLFARLTRLYTVLIPALMFGGLLDLAGVHHFGSATGLYSGHSQNHTLNFPIAQHLTVPILLGNYAFLQGIYVPMLGSNGPLWSLPNEFWYYVGFPFLACACWSRLSTLKRVISFLLLVAVLLFIHPAVALLGLIWLMGVAIHFLPPLPLSSTTARRATITLALLLTVGVLFWAKRVHTNGADYIVGIAVTVLIYAVLHGARQLPSRAYCWTAQLLSRSSYTLYLVHLPLLVFLTAWLVPNRMVPDPRSFLLAFVIFAVVFGYAQLVWFFFENRTDALRAWLKPRLFRPGKGSSLQPKGRRPESVTPA